MTDSISNKIRNMIFVCACLVVLIHITRNVDFNGSAWWMFAAGSETICRVAVPFFFLVSGYLVAGHFHDNWYWLGELKKRIRTVLLPYIVIAIAYAVFLMCLSHRTGIPSVVDILGLNLYRLPLLGPLWFLRALLILMLILPIVRWIVMQKRMSAIAVSVLLVCWLFFQPWTGDIQTPFQKLVVYGISIEGIAFFMVGAHLRVHSINRMFSSATCCCVTMILILVRLFSLRYGFAYHDLILRVAIPCMMVSLWRLIPDHVLWPRLISLSMPVYLLHKFGIIVVAATFRHMRFYSLCEINVLCYLAYYIVILLSTIVLCLSIRRCFPTVYKLITGGR